jgi:putative ABC transport system permease protein
VTEAFFVLNRLQAQDGRTLSDLDRFQAYAVLGSGQAAALAEGGDPTALVGRQIVVEGRVTSIIGVLAPSGSASHAGGSVNTGLLLPATTFTRILPSVEISAVLAEARRTGRTEAVIDDIRTFFRAHAGGLGLQISSADQELAAMRRQLRLMTVFLGVAGSLAFVLGGASMLNGMLATVSERRREIGLRRALGASRADIRAQFLYEALLLSLGGAVIGGALGLTAATAIAHFAGWSLLVSPPVLMLGMFVTVATGLAAGGIPAWQAARLDPIQAMLSTD